MKNKTFAVATVAMFVGMGIGSVAPVQAQLGGLIKGGAVALIVDKFSGDIDRFINKASGNRTAGEGESTRVVPIITVGKGGYAGAVQVSGLKENVDRVKAVAQIEAGTKIPLVGQIRARVLIPISDKTASDEKSISRVKGVGVSALIDTKL